MGAVNESQKNTRKVFEYNLKFKLKPLEADVVGLYNNIRMTNEFLTGCKQKHRKFFKIEINFPVQNLLPFILISTGKKKLSFFSHYSRE
jgi:hypothetical protein